MKTKSKGGAVAVRKETGVVSWKEELAKETEALGARIAAPGGDKIKLTKKKTFRLPDGTESPGPLTVVILDFVSMNTFHDKAYKEGEISPPACFAVGTDINSMTPSKSSPDRQSESCTKCPNNEFGSKGTGKACKNTRRLAVVVGTGDGASDVNSPMYILDVSPTGLKAFDAYVGMVRTQFEVPPVAMITDVFFDPTVDHQSLRFGNPQPNPNAEMHFSRKATARTRLLTEPDVSKYERPKKGKK